MSEKQKKKTEYFENRKEFNGLKVNEGIEQPPSINPNAISRFKKKRKKLPTASEFVQGIRESNRAILSQAITLIESSLPEHNSIAQEIIEKCLPFSGDSIRIGITGVPGVGKSTFIETFGKHAIDQNRKLAVLAIDPSSEKSKGSILGDKTRMEILSNDPNCFVRPSPSAGSLGGVARKTRESIVLCEAAGYNTIFIETVGVGQSETAVHSMVDFFLLLMLGGAGDELQGIKRGIMEMADAIAITKADGTNVQHAEIAKGVYRNALHLFPVTESGWSPQVHTCSAVKGNGIREIWQTIMDHSKELAANNYFELNRSRQGNYWMYETINESLQNNFYNDPRIKTLINKLEKKVLAKNVSSFEAARQLLNNYYNSDG